MFNEYLRKILPIPIVEIEISQKDNYLYRITTYATVIDESGTIDAIKRRIKSNKKIKSIGDWFFKDKDTSFKQAIVEFVK